MTRLRQSRRASTFFVAIAALAWFFASNHCAFAGVEPAHVAAHACCHEEDGKNAPPVSGAVMQCCDTFNVALPATVAAPSTLLYELQPLWMEASLLPKVLPAPARLPLATTGPPRALGFAEMVLNRSLLSHAPPRFVA